MSKYNTKVNRPVTKTVNRAGGEAFKESDKLALVSILLTSFVNDQFYRSEGETLSELLGLLDNLQDKKFAAKAAVYARNQFGMRSITHILAAGIGKTVKGEEWTRSFFSKVVRRADDMLEIVAAYKKLYPDDALPNSMKAGLRNAFGKFDAYQLAKYRGENKEFKLVDLVNLLHPVPTKKNGDALKALVNGTLKNEKTWEAKLSEAGKSESKEDAKAGAWAELITSGEIQYFALLRNLRNIVEQAPDVLDEALELLVDSDRIEKSLVLPFRYITAFEEIEKLSDSKNVRKVKKAIETALDISCAFVPEDSGESVVVLDCSGSMEGRPAFIGSMFVGILAKAYNADVMLFSDRAQYVKVNHSDSVMTIAKSLRFASGGTNFRDIFPKMNKAYDRVFILSDMQGWIGYGAPVDTLVAYQKKFDATPKVFSFDLQGYGQLEFPEKDVYAIAGFSDKTLDLIEMLEQDRNALIAEIEKVEL